MAQQGTRYTSDQVDSLNSGLEKSDLPAYAKLVTEFGSVFYMNELEMEMGRESKL